MHLELLNFIQQYINQKRLVAVTICHCWDIATLLAFATLINDNSCYTKFINLKDASETFENLEYRLLEFRTSVMGVLVDINCPKSTTLLNAASSVHAYGQSKAWLVFDKYPNSERIQLQFSNASLSIDADLTYALMSRSSDDNLINFTVHDVYNNGHQIGGKLNVTTDRTVICSKINCQVGNYLSNLRLRTKYGNRNSMKDVTFRMSAVATRLPVSQMTAADIYKFLLSTDNVLFDPIPRFGMQSTLPLLDMLYLGNLTVKYYDRWSTKMLEGGVVGDIINEEADIHSAPFILIKGRLQYVSVLAETGVFRSVCLFRTPHNVNINGGTFLEPFSTKVWLVFITFLMCSALVLWGVFSIEYYNLRNMYRMLEFVPSLLTTSLVAFGSACNQGSYFVPESIGGRITFFALSLTAFLVNNYYTSVIVSILLGSIRKSDITTVAQLAESNLDVGIELTSYTMIFLNVSKLPDIQRFVHRKIMSKKNTSSVWHTIVDGIKKMRDNPGYAFVFEGFQGYLVISRYFRPHEICDLNELIFRPNKGLYLHAHRNGTYKELLRLRQVRVFETGVYLKHRLYWAREKLDCTAANIVTEVGLNYTAPLFMIMVIVFGLVLIILGLEILFSRSLKNKYTRGPN